MTIQTQRQILAMVTRKWETSKHGDVYMEPQGRNSIYFTVFGIEHYRILLSVIVGPRGGMKERTLVVDPTEAVQLNQLIAFYTGYDGFLNLKAMRLQVTHSRTVLEVCRTHFGIRVRHAAEGSPHSLAEVHRLEFLCKQQLRFVQGGAPGLGRR